MRLWQRSRKENTESAAFFKRLGFTFHSVEWINGQEAIVMRSKPENPEVRSVKLNEKEPYIVAELSANHRQDKSIALESIRAAADCGVDAIKIQTYTPDTLTIDCDNEFFRIKQGTIWDGRTLYDLYREAFTPWEWHAELKRVRRGKRTGFLFVPLRQYRR